MNILKNKTFFLLPYVYFIAIACGFAMIHFLLINQSNNKSDDLIFTVLPWAGLIFLLWQKKEQINLESDYLSSIMGFLLIGLILMKSVNLFWFEASFIKVIPLLGIIGLLLITSGFKSLKNYAREIIILTIFIIPSDSLERIVNRVFQVNVLTAKMSTMFLWYSGIEVSSDGAIINFPDSSVFVDYPCTGVSSMLILLKLSILAICVFNKSLKITIFLTFISIIIGFFLGVIRASILALIIKDTELFNYWHGDDGGSIFAMISMGVFALIYNFILPKIEKPKTQILQQFSD